MQQGERLMVRCEEAEGMELLRCRGCPGSWQVPGAHELLVCPPAEGAGVQSRANSLSIPTPASHFCQLSSSVSHRHPHAHCQRPRGVPAHTYLFLRDITTSLPAGPHVQLGLPKPNSAAWRGAGIPALFLTTPMGVVPHFPTCKTKGSVQLCCRGKTATSKPTAVIPRMCLCMGI